MRMGCLSANPGRSAPDGLGEVRFVHLTEIEPKRPRLGAPRQSIMDITATGL